MVDENKISFTDTNTDVSNQEGNSTQQQLGEKQWYVVATYSTHERKAADNLAKRVETMGLSNLIFRIVVAEQDVPVMKDGQPTGKTRKKNLYPGYVFVEMIMTDYAWYVVRNTPGVTGFVGSSGKGTKPFPVKREQIEPVLKRMGMIEQSMYEGYEEGKLVKIISGSFEGLEGTITKIDQENHSVEVKINFFGRDTAIGLDFADIEKI